MLFCFIVAGFAVPIYKQFIYCQLEKMHYNSVIIKQPGWMDH